MKHNNANYLKNHCARCIFGTIYIDDMGHIVDYACNLSVDQKTPTKSPYTCLDFVDGRPSVISKNKHIKPMKHRGLKWFLHKIIHRGK